MKNEEQKGERLEIGSVVRLRGDYTYFMIYVVWKDSGSKKWFPVAVGDGRDWPLPDKVKKQF